ncbi:GntR family transcriptional regulator [Streptomyces capitiformicae]|uniref:GntR family transcriptional regulator n=1 Tax=Streptomyces capitiformicae TaxID=2014920 RepID=UPI00167237CB|nr:GntR family transcriptional regulator [Streptomyces capitiformicae]
MEERLRELLAVRQPGDILPPQRELVLMFDVSRYTVQKVLQKLTDEGWIESRQGSGIRVLRVPSAPGPQPLPGQRGSVMPGPVFARAFDRPEVFLDVYSLTSESLYGYVRMQADRIVAGEIDTERVIVRMLLPWEEQPLEYPRAVDPGDLCVWERWRATARQQQAQMHSLLEQLSEHIEVSLQIRRTPMTPEFKLYVLNKSEMLWGPYKIIEREIPFDDGTKVLSKDVLGLGSRLFHEVREEGDDSHNSSFFKSMQDRFESHWGHLGVPSMTS